MKDDIETLYKRWCKETKRNGSVLVGGSIKEFFEWLERPSSVDISRLLVKTKYRSPTEKSTIAVYMTNIPEFVKKLNEEYILIKK